MRATYSPEDNKLRLYADGRLDADTFARVKAAGFRWAPRQELFVAPMWTPEREDLLAELAGEVEDEDTSLVERQEQRAARFDEYSDSRRSDAESARRAVSAIADHIPFGQPILVGHHSEKHARRDAEKIQNGMRRAVRMWETAQYWQQRAAGALRHAKYKELPSVRARRIKTLEADARKIARNLERCRTLLQLWNKDRDRIEAGTQELTQARALAIANHDGSSFCFTLADYPRREGQSTYEGRQSLWSALKDEIITPEQARELATAVHTLDIERLERWAAHYENRIAYERAMLAEAGGIIAERDGGPKKGGAVRCWVERGRWLFVQKVNKVSVTVLDNWGNGGRDFTRTVEFDKLAGVMSPDEVAAARTAGRIVDENARGFILADAPRPTPPPEDLVCPDGPSCPDDGCRHERAAQGIELDAPAPSFEQLRDSLRAGVQVVSAPQLFPTPPELAARVIELADIGRSSTVLEPSAGTGELIRALPGECGRITAVEINGALCDRLRGLWREDFVTVRRGDFLELTPADLGTFDRVVMNPPFERGADIRHIQHARQFLKFGGLLVAICANGPRQREQLQPIAREWVDLGPGLFQGTNVNTALVVIEGGLNPVRDVVDEIAKAEAGAGELAEVPFSLTPEHARAAGVQDGLF